MTTTWPVNPRRELPRGTCRVLRKDERDTHRAGQVSMTGEASSGARRSWNPTFTRLAIGRPGEPRVHSAPQEPQELRGPSYAMHCSQDTLVSYATPAGPDAWAS